jgi:hypothetical protein
MTVRIYNRINRRTALICIASRSLYSSPDDESLSPMVKTGNRILSDNQFQVDHNRKAHWQCPDRR